MFSLRRTKIGQRRCVWSHRIGSCSESRLNMYKCVPCQIVQRYWINAKLEYWELILFMTLPREKYPPAIYKAWLSETDGGNRIKDRRPMVLIRWTKNTPLHLIPKCWTAAKDWGERDFFSAFYICLLFAIKEHNSFEAYCYLYLHH